MADRVLRGSRLGTTSYETDRDTDLAPRREVTYDCLNGHETRMPMAVDAELPATWECRTCGATHWDMLLERRSLDDLEDVLNERLAELRPRPRKSA